MNRIFTTLCVTVLLLSMQVSWGADLKKGVAAYEAGDYATALRELTPLAEQGDPAAQSNLGVMYHTGQGVPRNDKISVKWYTLAAEQGNTDAQKRLDELNQR